MANRRGWRRAVRTKLRGSGSMRARRILPRVGDQRLHGLAHFERRRGRRQRRAEADRDRMRQAFGKTAHHSAALKTGRAAQHAVERDGNDRRVHIFHDALEAALERQQLADARDLALGKNADDFAVADGVAGGLQRVEQFARTLFGRNGNRRREFWRTV